MAADITDKARKSYSLLTKSLSAGISDVDTTIPFNNVTNIPTDTAVDFIIDRVDSNGTATPTLRELCKGVVSGSNLINCVRGVHGTTAQSHLSGAVVEFIVSASAHNDLIDLILADHSQSGTHEIATNYDPSNPTLETQKWVGVSSAVNEVTVTNATTGNSPTIEATGGDTNADITLKGKGTGKVKLGQSTSTGVQLEADQPILDSSGNEQIKFSKTASAVNEVTVTNAATGGAPSIAATGGDTDVNLNLNAKGAGVVKLGGLRRQDNTTDSTEDNVLTQYGWGFKIGESDISVSETITFPTAYTSAPVVVVSLAGYKNSSDPATIDELNGNFTVQSVSCGVSSISTTGFTITITSDTGTTMANTLRIGYTWVAYGPKT